MRSMYNNGSSVILSNLSIWLYEQSYEKNITELSHYDAISLDAVYMKQRYPVMTSKYLWRLLWSTFRCARLIHQTLEEA